MTETIWSQIWAVKIGLRQCNVTLSNVTQWNMYFRYWNVTPSGAATFPNWGITSLIIWACGKGVLRKTYTILQAKQTGRRTRNRLWARCLDNIHVLCWSWELIEDSCIWQDLMKGALKDSSPTALPAMYEESAFFLTKIRN